MVFIKNVPQLPRQLNILFRIAKGSIENIKTVEMFAINLTRT